MFSFGMLLKQIKLIKLFFLGYYLNLLLGIMLINIITKNVLLYANLFYFIFLL